MSKYSKATLALMDELHRLTAQQLVDIITNGVPVRDREGNEVGRDPAPAAFIAAAIKFLKDNDITADKDSDRINKVEEALKDVPEFDDDEAYDLNFMQ